MLVLFLCMVYSCDLVSVSSVIQNLFGADLSHVNRYDGEKQNRNETGICCVMEEKKGFSYKLVYLCHIYLHLLPCAGNLFYFESCFRLKWRVFT